MLPLQNTHIIHQSFTKVYSFGLFDAESIVLFNSFVASFEYW